MTTITHAGRVVRLIPKGTPPPKPITTRKRARGYWTAEQFEQIASGRNTRTKQAARRHLVDGITQDQAAKEVGITRAAITAALRRLRRKADVCPTCGRQLGKDDSLVSHDDGDRNPRVR